MAEEQKSASDMALKVSGDFLKLERLRAEIAHFESLEGPTISAQVGEHDYSGKPCFTVKVPVADVLAIARAQESALSAAIITDLGLIYERVG